MNYLLPARRVAALSVYLPQISRFCLIAAALALVASNGYGQTAGSSRPVARLISSSQPADPRRPSAALASPTSAPVMANSAGISIDLSLERRAFNLVNEQRARNGEPALVWDAELCQMARRHSEKMASGNFFDHTGPDGMGMVERARAQGIGGWRLLGENIAYNQGFDDPGAFAVERWMISAKHRSNILNGLFTHSAIGVARAADGRVFLTQVFMAR